MCRVVGCCRVKPHRLTIVGYSLGAAKAVLLGMWAAEKLGHLLSSKVGPAGRQAGFRAVAAAGWA